MRIGGACLPLCSKLICVPCRPRVHDVPRRAMPCHAMQRCINRSAATLLPPHAAGAAATTVRCLPSSSPRSGGPPYLPSTAALRYRACSGCPASGASEPVACPPLPAPPRICEAAAAELMPWPRPAGRGRRHGRPAGGPDRGARVWVPRHAGQQRGRRRRCARAALPRLYDWVGLRGDMRAKVQVQLSEVPRGRHQPPAHPSAPACRPRQRGSPEQRPAGLHGRALGALPPLLHRWAAAPLLLPLPPTLLLLPPTLLLLPLPPPLALPLTPEDAQPAVSVPAGTLVLTPAAHLTALHWTFKEDRRRTLRRADEGASSGWRASLQGMERQLQNPLGAQSDCRDPLCLWCLTPCRPAAG